MINCVVVFWKVIFLCACGRWKVKMIVFVAALLSCALLIFLQGGLAFGRTSATSCWSSSPSCESTATCPTTSNAATTLRRPRICPSLSRLQRSPPCSIRRLAWWSHRALGNTLSRLLNSASTCLTNSVSQLMWKGLLYWCVQSHEAKTAEDVWFFTCCPGGFGPPHLNSASACLPRVTN